MPSRVGVGGGDYIEFRYCLDCGRIQDSNRATFPIPDERIEEVFEEE